MGCDSPRFVNTGVSFGRTSKSEFHIFQVRLKHLVQAADLLEDGAAHEYRSERRELNRS